MKEDTPALLASCLAAVHDAFEDAGIWHTLMYGTLLGALRKRGLKKGVAALCIGGGEATAMAVELV